VSQDSLVDNAINSQIGSIRSQLRYMLNSIQKFGPFSNDKWIPADPGAYPSLEDIHDNIHVLCGGPSPSQIKAPAGNMSIVPYAAFDPVFWLHHW
jgi:tyrosinase